MIKKQIYAMMCMLLMTQFIGCTTKESTISSYNEQVETKKDGEEQVLSGKTLNWTTEQKLDDFKYLYDTMNSLYPYWGEIEETGKDRESIYETYVEKVRTATSDEAFLNTVLAYFNELDAYTIGHLGPIVPGAYDSFHQLYAPSENRRSWAKVLGNPISSQMYALFETTDEWRIIEKGSNKQTLNTNERSKEAESTQEIESNQLEEVQFSMKILEEGKIGYIKVPSFDSLHMEKEIPQIQDFIKTHNSVENIIIDIRGNGGGSDNYWMSAFVQPNIQETKYYSNYYLYSQAILENPLSKPFLKEIHPNLFTDKTKISELPQLSQLSPYASTFDYFTCQTREVRPEKNEIPYTGKFWVLMDERNASASASFIQFCKENQFATLVGKGDNGDNCNGDPFLLSLPHSGLIIRFDLFYGLNSDGSCNGVSGCKPDVECSSEEALEVCIKDIKAN